MPLTILNVLLGAGLLLSVGAAIWFARERKRAEQRLGSFRSEVIDAAADALVGSRLDTTDGEFGELGKTINSLLDALGERDEKIQDRDRLFVDFARTLPEIVVVHNERILLANGSASALVGLGPEQLVDRDVADLVETGHIASRVARPVLSSVRPKGWMPIPMMATSVMAGLLRDAFERWGRRAAQAAGLKA